MRQCLRRSSHVAIAVFCAIAFLQSTAQAQVLYGSIQGTVTDAAGSSVPAAKIRITSAGTRQSRETVTDDAGNYTFPSIAGDAYEIVITKEGFQTFTVRNVAV